MDRYIVSGAYVTNVSIIVEANSRQEATDKSIAVPLDKWENSGTEFEYGSTELEED